MLAALLAAGGFAAWVLDDGWLKGSSALVHAVAVTALSAALIVGCVRALRAGLRIDAQGVTVRNLLRTYKFSCPEVSHLGDGHVEWDDTGHTVRAWRLCVVLHDGRRLRCETIGRTVPLEAIKRAAARYGVRTELTGVVWTGHRFD
jgi:hypothetical protein